MKKVDRYLPVLKKDKKGKPRASVHKDPYGKYMLFEEHAKRMASVKNQLFSQEILWKKIRSLEDENERLRSLCGSHGVYDFQL